MVGGADRPLVHNAAAVTSPPEHVTIPADDAARWAGVDADIARLCTREALSATTQATYASKWVDWVGFCASRGYGNPLAAPFEVFEALVGAAAGRRIWPGRHGRPCSPGHFAANLSAVGHGYDTAGVIPAFRRAAHEGDWQELLAGYRRGYAHHHGPFSTRRPMGARDAYDVLTVEPDGWSGTAGAALIVLTALLTDSPAGQVAGTVVGDIAPLPAGDGVIVRVGDGTYPVMCNHPAGGLAAAGFGWGCPACTLARAGNDWPAHTTFGGLGGGLAHFGLVAAKRVVALDRHTSGGGSRRQTQFVFPDRATPLQRSGVVSLLCHAAGPVGAHLAYVQARLVGCWAVGLSAAQPADQVLGRPSPSGQTGLSAGCYPGSTSP